MSFVATAAIAATLINAALGGLVFLANPRSAVNRVYALWSASVVTWNFSAYQACLPGTPREGALVWLRVLQTAVIFMPVLIFHLCEIVVHGGAARWLRWVYLLHVGFVASLAGTWFMRDVQLISVGWWAVAGPLFWVFFASYSALVLTLFIRLPKDAARAPRTQQRRIWALWVATITLGCLGSNDIMPILGLSYYPGTRLAFIPLGNLGAIFYGAAVGYSVLQHELLDIQIGLSKVAAHAIRLLFLLLVGFLILLGVSIVAPEGSITSFAFWICLAVLLGSGLVASLSMPKLLGGGTESLESRLLGDRFEYQDKIREFTDQCRWHTELDGLLNDLDSLLVNALNVRSYWIILLDEADREFGIAGSYPKDSAIEIPDLRADSPAFRVFTGEKCTHLSLRADTKARNPSEAAAREQLKTIPGDLAFPLVVEQHPIGLLILGEKTGGHGFTRTDLRLLLSLTRNIALVINQISLKNQVHLSKELDLLGRMSRGMAHDLNNLTTPVWTVLQLLGEGVSADLLRADLVPIATRNIQTMREYIKEALFFSENLRPDLRTSRLDTLVQEVLEAAQENKRKGKNINYVFRSCGDVSVEMDQVLIRRLLTNIINNAVDASKKGASIEIEIIRLIKTEAARDWFRIRIADHGSGISPENLDRIFDPYWTTKRTGDEDRGFGLGLAICRKIATLHGGNLVVSSEIDRGTIVNFDLPSRQKTLKPPQAMALEPSSR